MRMLTVLFLTGLLVGCGGGQGPFRQVQLCLADAEDTARFVEVMRSVSMSHHMQYHDRSAITQKELVTLQKAPDYPVLKIGAHDGSGVGWGGGNFGLSAYEMSVGFSEGTDPAAAHAFAEHVIRRLSSKWTVYEGPSNRGALPLCQKVGAAQHHRSTARMSGAMAATDMHPLARKGAERQTIPEPRPLRGMVIGVDLPPSHAGRAEAWAVLSVEEDDGTSSTYYMYYAGNEVPQPGQRCVFEVGPAFVKGLVGREVWSKGRHVTGLLRADCEASRDLRLSAPGR